MPKLQQQLEEMQQQNEILLGQLQETEEDRLGSEEDTHITRLRGKLATIEALSKQNAKNEAEKNKKTARKWLITFMIFSP